MPRLQQSKDRFFLSVPKCLVNQKGWQKGEELVLIFNERGNIEITDNMKRNT